jgi:hypothetical protein
MYDGIVKFSEELGPQKVNYLEKRAVEVSSHYLISPLCQI